MAPPCEVRSCTRPGVELHHWSPRAFFGKSADAWPTARLCLAHHAEWHRRTTPELWAMRLRAIAEQKAQRKAAADRMPIIDLGGMQI
jgi:hypothetical protein